MDVTTRIERALEQALDSGGQAGCPPGLARAVHYAVFPGGARVRPRLCLAVAAACGDPDPALSDAAAVAIELLHCASLVHDDLPCFDDAPMRRGKPSVHSAFGERLAVLTGDALIVHAFEALARGGLRRPERLPALIATVAAATGMPTGIVAGQAWECETHVDLADYQRAASEHRQPRRFARSCNPQADNAVSQRDPEPCSLFQPEQSLAPLSGATSISPYLQGRDLNEHL